MNGFSNMSCSGARLKGAGVLGVALVLAGCADLRRAVTLPPVNPESPVASIVEPASRGNFATPRLSDVPPLPKNVPSADVVKVGVLSMVRCRRGLERYPLTHPPLSGGTEQFAANARDVAQVNAADVPPADSAARTDAFAASLRSAVSPPAAIDPGSSLSADQSRPPSGDGAHPVAARPPARSPVAHSAAARKPVVSPPAVASTSAAPPAASAPARGVETDTAPPLPPPLPDPLLARCT